MVRRLAPVLLLLSAMLPLAATAADRPFQPVGLWRFFHTDGSAFLARLHPDQSATTTFGQGEVGIWRWEGDHVRLYYTDGWDDLLYRRDGAFRKSAWKPGADRCGAPTNDTPAQHLSDDPRAAPQ